MLPRLFIQHEFVHHLPRASERLRDVEFIATGQIMLYVAEK